MVLRNLKFLHTNPFPLNIYPLNPYSVNLDLYTLDSNHSAMVSRISGSLEEVFKKFDTDKSGQIDANELKALFEMLHCDIDDVSTCVYVCIYV
jgi:hypothetical protein